MTAEAAFVVDAPLEVPDGADGRGTHDAGAAGGRETHDLGAPAIVVHTSGSSGAPKPVELTYGNWLWSALGSAAALGVDPQERWLCCLPLAHVGGLSILIRSAIYGTSAVVHERFETERVLAALSEPDGPTLVSLVPTTLERLLDAGLREPPALRWALLGGAPMSAALLERAANAGVPVAPTYGMTEACSQVATFGHPLFCTRVTIAGDGEVLVSGPTVAPAAGPVLRTGDLGAFDDHGRLTITGRKVGHDHLRRRERLAAGGRGRARRAPGGRRGRGLRRARRRVGRGDRRAGRARRGAAATGAELAAWCAERLAPFKVPKRFVFVSELPRTASGKLARGELRG